MRIKPVRMFSVRILAILMTFAVMLAYLPAVAYAGAGAENANLDELSQAIEEAKAARDASKAEMDAAKAEKDKAYKAWQEKKADADAAAAKAGETEIAFHKAEEIRDKAFTEKKTQAEEAYNDATKAYNEASGAYDNAVADLQKKINELETAKTAKTALEGTISTITAEKDAAQSLVNSLPGEIEAATQIKTEAENKWAQDKVNAETAVTLAQNAYDEKGVEFINTKINALGAQFYTLDEMIDICKGYSDAKFSTPTKFNGKTIATLADAANDASFKDIVKSNCTKENLLFAMDMIDKSNEIRQIEGKSVMGVSYQLTGAAIMSNSFTAYCTGHTLYNKNGKTPEGYANTDSFWTIGPADKENENLYYSGASIQNVSAPYDGWYTKEKKAMENAVASGKWPGLSIDMTTRDIWTNYPNLSSETKSAGYGQVGHFLTLRNEEYTTTGAAVAYNTGELPTEWRGRATQSFNNDNTNSISVAQCRNDINEAFASVENALNQAKAKEEELQSAPAEVITARETLNEKEQALETAQQTLSEKNAILEEKNAELSTLNEDIQSKASAKDEAEQKKIAAEMSKTAAKTNLGQKKEINNKAQKLDYSKPETFADYSDLKTLVDTAESAQTAYESAKEAADAAQTEADKKKSEYDTSEEAYKQKESVYNKNEQALEKAESDYNAAMLAIEKAEAEAKAKAEAEALAKAAAEMQRLDNLEWNGTLNTKIPAVKGAKFKAAKKKITVSWKKATKKNLKKFDKVEVQVCPNKAFKRTDTKRVEVKKKKKSVAVKKLKKGTYFVRVRDVKGAGTAKQVSKWSKVKKVKVK